MKTENYKIGNKIKSKRIEKGIKQNTLANELKISQASLSRIENGKEEAGINTLLNISEILETPINYFTSDPVNINQQHSNFENSNGVYISQQLESNEYKDICKQKDFIIDNLQKEIQKLNERIERRNIKIDELTIRLNNLI